MYVLRPLFLLGRKGRQKEDFFQDVGAKKCPKWNVGGQGSSFGWLKAKLALLVLPDFAFHPYCAK